MDSDVFSAGIDLMFRIVCTVAALCGAALIGLVWLLVWWFTPSPAPAEPARFSAAEQRYLGDLSSLAASEVLRQRIKPEPDFDAEFLQRLEVASQWAWEHSMDLVTEAEP